MKKIYNLVWTTVFLLSFLLISTWIIFLIYFEISDAILGRYQGSIIIDILLFLGWLSFFPVMKLVIDNYPRQKRK